MSEIRSQATSGLGLEVVARVQADGLRRTEVLDREGNQLFQMTDCTEAGTEIAEGLATMLNNWTPPPRTITSAAELDALPNMAVVMDNCDDVSQKRGGQWCGYETADLTSKQIAKYGPITVIFTPGEAG